MLTIFEKYAIIKPKATNATKQRKNERVWGRAPSGVWGRAPRFKKEWVV